MSVAADPAGLPTLRLLTCGSVDDGKSTLIGRMLYEKKLIFDDQLSDARARFEEVRHDRRGYRLCASGRRAGGRTRTGHHHRRRLPLFRDRTALVHRRRYAGARTIHPQHGDGGVQRRSCGPAGRCAQGPAHADPSAFDHRFAARHPPRRACGQQDRPRRLQREVFRRIEADYRRFAETLGFRR